MTNLKSPITIEGLGVNTEYSIGNESYKSLFTITSKDASLELTNPDSEYKAQIEIASTGLITDSSDETNDYSSDLTVSDDDLIINQCPNDCNPICTTLNFSPFIEFGFNPISIWELLAASTNEQINESHFTDFVTSFNTSITNAYKKYVDDIINNLDLKTTLGGLTNVVDEADNKVDKIQILIKLANSGTWTLADYSLEDNCLFNRSNIGTLANPIYALSPKQYNSADLGIFSNSFISCRGVDITALSSGLDVATLWTVLSTYDNTHSININYIDIASYLSANHFITQTAVQDLINASIESNKYTLPVASAVQLGGVKIDGGSLVINPSSGLLAITKDSGVIKELYDAQYFEGDTVDTSAIRLKQAYTGLISYGYISCKGVDSTASSTGIDTATLWTILSNYDGTHHININYVDIATYLSTNNFINKPTIQGLIDASIESHKYSLPIASATQLGGVIINGGSLTIDAQTGLLSVTKDTGVIKDLIDAQFFEKDTEDTSAVRLKQTYTGLVSYGYVSVKGVDSTSSSSGIDTATLWAILTAVDSTKVIDISHIPTTKISYNDLLNKPTIPSLDGFATQTWVTENFTSLTTFNTFRDAINSSINDITGNITILFGRKITAGNGLTGGGDLSKDITLSVVAANKSIDVSASGIKVVLANNLTTNTEDTEYPLSAYQGYLIGGRLTSLEDLFVLTNDNLAVYTKHDRGLFSNNYVSVKGVDPTSAFSTFDVSTLWDCLVNYDNNTSHIINLSYLPSIPYSKITGTPSIPSLDGYATQSWVNTTLTNYYTSTQVDTAIASAISVVYKYKGSKDTYEDLPATGNAVGDVYNVVAAHGTIPAGTNYAWNGASWDALGGSVDLSPYMLISTFNAYKIIAGKGLTGGGFLKDNPTIDIGATNESIQVADDGISVKIENDLLATSTSVLPLSAYQGTLIGNRLTLLEDLFRVTSDDTAVYTNKNRGLYSNSYISVKGVDATSGGTGIDLTSMWSALINYDNTASHQINSNYLTTALSTYATQQWVLDKNYLTTHQSLYTLTIKENENSIGTYNPATSPNQTISFSAITSMTVPAFLTYALSSGTAALTLTSGYYIPSTTDQTNWNTAATTASTLAGYFTGSSANSASTATQLSAARTFTIKDADSTNSGAVSASFLNSTTTNLDILLPSTIKAALTGNASSASQLANTHTLWGQSFNGTQNVSGNLSGVGAITASGRFKSNGYLLQNTQNALYGLVPNDYVTTGGTSTDIWLYNTTLVNICGGKGVSVKAGPFKSFFASSTNGDVSFGYKVGIGTTTPDQLLQIRGGHGTTQEHLYAYVNGGTRDANLYLWASEPHLTYTGVGISNNWRCSGESWARQNTGAGGSYIRLLENNIVFNTIDTSGNNITNMSVSGGNVGIGIAASVYKLDVNGDIRASGLITANGGIVTSTTNTYDIGSSSAVFKNIYATTFNGALNGNANSANNANLLAGKNSDYFLYNNLRFASKWGTSTDRGVDVNTLLEDGGMISNYASNIYWANTPIGLGYGSIISLMAANRRTTDGLEGQFAWDVNHNSTPSTRNLWFRAKNNLGWQTNQDWKRVVLADGRDYSITANNADNLGNIAAANYLLKTNAAATYALLSHTHDFSSLTNKPTTLAGYGITDAASLNHSHYYLVTKGNYRSVATSPNDYIDTLTFNGLKYNSTIGTISTSRYSYLLGLRGWGDDSGGHAWEIAFNDDGIEVRNGATTSWNTFQKLLTSGNYTSYVPTIAQYNTNVSNITTLQGYFTNGVANSANKLATARTLWGQSFNGTANVSGSLTGVTTLNASGLATINSLLVTNATTLAGATTLQSSLQVAGGVELRNVLTVAGLATFNAATSAITAPNGTINSAVGVYSAGYISCKGVDATSGGTSGIDVAGLWTELGGSTTNKVIDISHLPVSSIISSCITGVVSSGSGDIVTSLSKSGQNIQYTLGLSSSSFASASHTHNYVSSVTIGTVVYSVLSNNITIPAYPTTLPASDVSAWAKASTKPLYTTSEVSEDTNLYFTNARAVSALTTTLANYMLISTFNTYQVIAGNGLINGGYLKDNPTLNIGATNASIVVASDGISVGLQNDLLAASDSVLPLAAYQGNILNQLITGVSNRVTTLESLIGLDVDNNAVYIKNNYNFYSNGFISCKGVDATAGEGVGLDLTAMWTALGANTSESINITHIPDLSSVYTPLTTYNSFVSATNSSLTSLTSAVDSKITTGSLKSLTFKLGTTEELTYNPESTAVSIGLIAGTNINITYANNAFTIANTYSYALPTASATQLGGIKVGSGLSINSTSGVLTATYSYTLPLATTTALGGIQLGYTTTGKNYAVQLSGNNAYVNVPWTDTVYTHPTNGANTTIAAATGKVLASITVDSLGHTTAVAAKTLVAADIPDLSSTYTPLSTYNSFVSTTNSSISSLSTTVGTKITTGSLKALTFRLGTTDEFSYNPESAATAVSLTAGSNISISYASNAFTIANTYSYTHHTQSAITASAGTGYVVSGVTVNTEGHTTAVATRALTASDIPSHTHSYASSVTVGTTVYSVSSNNITIPAYPTTLPANGGNADTVDNLHAADFARIGQHNNLIADGNEFTFASDAYSGPVIFNYRTASGATNGAITQYYFGNGAGNYTPLLLAGGFIVGSYNSSSYILTSDGGVLATSTFATSGHTHSNYASSVTSSGTGNVVTALSQSGNVITFTKGITALVSHQSIYALTLQRNGTSVGSYTPNSAVATLNINACTSITVPTGLTSAALTSAGVIALTLTSGYTIPTTANITQIGTNTTNISTNASNITTLQGYFTNGVAKKALVLNTARTIWGKSFDGSANISGDMTGVGSITMTGAISGCTTLAVSSTSTFGGKITANGGIGTTYLTASSTLSVTSYSTLTGNVGIGGAYNTSYKLYVTGNVYSTSTIYAATGIASDGYASCKGVDTTSDIRFKKNIVYLHSVLPTILKLDYFKHEWTDSEGTTLGLSAQQVRDETEFGYLIHTRNGKLSLEYSKLVVLALQGLKEEDNKVENLKKRVTALELENSKLKQALNLN